MLLPEKYCSITSENELIIDYRPEIEYCIKILPWDKQLQLKLLSGHGWQNSDHEPNIPLLTCAHEQEPNSVIARFTEHFPKVINLNLERYRYLQFTLLRLIASSHAAHDIFIDNPTLLWLFVHYHQFGNVFAEDILAQLTKRRREILDHIELPASKSILKLLAKIEPRHGSLEELQFVLWAIQTRHLLTRLSHFSSIPIGLLQVIKVIPDIVNSDIFNQYLSTGTLTSNLPINEPEAKQLLTVWRDIKRLSHSLGYGDATQMLSKIQTIEEIHELHNRWSERFNKKQEEDFVEVQFSDPPIPGNGDIEPITNSKQLQLEGKIMSHCVGTYVDTILSGESYIYQVLKPERATLQIGLDSEEIYIQQCKLYKNANPEPDTIDAIKTWISAFRRHQPV